MNLRA